MQDSTQGHNGFPIDDYEIPVRCILKNGETIDNYLIEKELGQGAFGIVYKVTDQSSNSVFALKLLKLWEVPYEDVRRSMLTRFKLEYDTGQIESDYLVRSTGYGKKSGNPYILLDFCPNGDLRSKMAPNLPFSYINELAVQILFGLNALHSNGKIHRDLKPDNVLLDANQRAKLTDFGIVGHANLKFRLTVTDWRGKPKELFGTYAYMPPEQIKPANKHVTIIPTTDIFSFGAMMFELITNRLPFGNLESESDLGEYVMKANKGKWTELRSLRPDTPVTWTEIIENCLQPDFRNRYQNTEDILRKLGKSLSENQIATSALSNEFQLKIMQGEEYGKIYNLTQLIKGDREGIICIGRKDDEVKNDLEIVEETTPYISRHHATIEKSAIPDAWFIRDGQWIQQEKQWTVSKNGTFVNSRQVSANGTILKPNDIITLGDTTLKVIFA
jgi:serine/threonine protein kinase